MDKLYRSALRAKVISELGVIYDRDWLVRPLYLNRAAENPQELFSLVHLQPYGVVGLVWLELVELAVEDCGAFETHERPVLILQEAKLLHILA